MGMLGSLECTLHNSCLSCMRPLVELLHRCIKPSVIYGSTVETLILLAFRGEE